MKSMKTICFVQVTHHLQPNLVLEGLEGRRVLLTMEAGASQVWGQEDLSVVSSVLP